MILGNGMEFFSCRHLVSRGTCPDEFQFSLRMPRMMFLILIYVVAEADLFLLRETAEFHIYAVHLVIRVVIRGLRTMVHCSYRSAV